MENIKIEERTLYPPLVNYLKSIGFNAIGESSLGSTHPDILFKKEDINFVIEVKIGNPQVGLDAVAQASNYARKLNTQNIVILIYPEKYRNQIVLDNKLVDEIALNKKIKILTLTEYWTESLDIEAKNFFNFLNDRFKNKLIKVDFKTIVNLIENYIKDINSIIFQIKTEVLIAEVVNQLDLFASIGDIKDKETAKKQIINLASYLLFNQILFYNIFKKKIPGNKLKELDEINSIKDLQFYFDSITNIDYKSIYRVNILGNIPENITILILLNQLIQAIKLLRAEHITHDLAGRFFHDLIPFEVRKVLAAFYTHPVAADILASLLIDSFDETIIDPACGSGTLLVSAYKRKQELYEQLYGFKNLKNMHKTFIESDITGIDLMPFASHITTITLTMQNIEQKTNIVRIAAQDSLDLANGILDEIRFKNRGIAITPYTETIQDSLFGTYGQKTSEGAVSPEGKGEDSFIIKPVDAVIMNPPFSDREKMPLKM
ncbi:MAG: N-6 DNA methylase, partial [Nitrososphaeraceae archaeon]|nr:N-6 DNA methylase [Nitrososphaeraceae archaeon]